MRFLKRLWPEILAAFVIGSLLGVGWLILR